MYRIKIPHANPDPEGSTWTYQYVIALEFSSGCSWYYRTSVSVEDAVMVPEPVARFIYEALCFNHIPCEMEKIV